MADETDTPTTPAGDAKPAPRRRATPRKAAGADAPKPRQTRRKAADPGVVVKAEEAVTGAASAAAATAKDAVAGAVGAVKPRASSRRTKRADGDAKPAPAKRTAARKADGAKKASGPGVRWGAIAAGGVAVAGAAAALLTLRGSSSGKSVGTAAKPIDSSGSGGHGMGQPTTVAGGSGGAHQPDGTDSSASFNAGIADENTVPDKV